MCVEEILRPILQDESVCNFDSMILLLHPLAKKSRTAHLSLKALILPVILIMRFVKSSKEANWPFHIHTLKMALPYLAVAGHWNNLRYTSVYLIKFFNKEHLEMEYRTSYGQIWWCKTIVIWYGHSPNGIMGLIINEKALDR